MEGTLLSSFRAALGAVSASDGALHPILARGLAAAAAELPSLPSPPAAFGAHLGRLLTTHAAHAPHAPDASEADVTAVLGEVRFADLYLAWACAAGNVEALRVFEERYGADVDRALSRVRVNGMDSADLKQELARRLFGPPAPKIADYSGRGDLRAWVRIVATRSALDFARLKRNGERRVDESALHAIVAGGDSPERAHFRQRYEAEIGEAITEAARSLTPEERNVLREHHVLGLTVDEIAVAHGIHRATAARRVQRARDVLVRRVKQLLGAKLGLAGADLASVMNLVQSQMHITMDRVLASTDAV